MNPLVSIVILSWNRRYDLKASLNQILKNQYSNIEIIVVDNASTDGTQEMVKKEFSQVNLVSLLNNIGIAGYNEGFKIAKGKYITVLDDDSYPATDAIMKAVEILERDQKIVGIAFHIIHPTDNISETKDWPEDVITFVGCGAILRRDVMEKSGYYDSNFYLYCNEFDLTIRILSQDKRYSIKYFSDIIGYHRVAASNRTITRRAYYQLRNFLWIIWRYFSFYNAIRLSFRLIFEEFIFAFTWYKSISTYLKSLFSAFSSLRKYLKLRKVISPQLEKKIIESESTQPVFGEPVPKFILNNIRSAVRKISRI